MNLNPPSMDGSTITDKLKGDRKIPFLLSKIHLKPFIFRMRIDSKRVFMQRHILTSNQMKHVLESKLEGVGICFL